MPNKPEEIMCTEQAQRLEVLRLANDIAMSQNSVKYNGLIDEETKLVQNTVLQDTLRNAKKLWKFVKIDPLAATTPEES
jgi:single-stranded DNA-specific DHH superfamily exonuclease